MANFDVKGNDMASHGRTLGEFTPLHPAEKELLKHSQAGSVALIGNKVPDERTPSNIIRAAFIRFLLMGGDNRVSVHDRGVRVTGAWIIGELDLSYSRVSLPASIEKCKFARKVTLYGLSSSNYLSLDGSHLRGIAGAGAAILGGIYLRGVISQIEVDFTAGRFSHFYCDGAKLGKAGRCSLSLDGAEVSESLHFEEGFKSFGELRMVGASVGGQLSFTGAFLDNFEVDVKKKIGQRKYALVMDGITVKQDVFLNEFFTALGDVRMCGAKINGDFNVVKATMRCLDASRIVVGGVFNFRGCADRINSIILARSKVAVLRDDGASWGKDIEINGFVYDFIDVKTNTIEARIDWLDAQCGGSIERDGLRFRPQPWRQLQQVLEAMGHIEEARCVGIRYEERLREFGVIRQSSVVKSVLHFFYGKLTAFGYRPQWLLGWFFSVWIGCAIFYWWAALSEAVFAPTDPIVFQNVEYSSCRPPSDANAELNKVPGEGNWYLCNALREEYTGFSPLAFSLDLLLPLVDLHQENDWGPLIFTPRSNAWDEVKGVLDIRRLVRIVMWGEILAGWGFSLLFVAIVSGLTRRSD